MSFVGPTLEKNIATTNGKTYKVFLTAQEGGYWVATVLYAVEGIVTTKNILGNGKEDAYAEAIAWVKANIDEKARIEPL